MKTLTFKVTDEEDHAIRTQARRARLTVSEYLRRKIRSSTVPGVSVEVVYSQQTGAPMFVGTPEMTPLNVETIREALSDFP